MRFVYLCTLLIIVGGLTLCPVYGVQTYPTGISVILFTPDTTEYTEGQQVTLVGQITQMSGGTGTGEQITNVPYATYSIVDADTGNVITTGQANYQGEFEYAWTATSYTGKTEVHLAAVSDGVTSKPIDLTIYPVESPPRTMYQSSPSTNLSGLGQWYGTTNYPDTNAFNCVTESDYVYCVGGGLGSSAYRSYYAPLSSSGIGQWTPTTTYPDHITAQTCVAYDNHVYCVGGQTFPNSPPLQSYYAPLSSSGIGQWTPTTNYPVSIINPSCTAQSGYIYCSNSVPGSAQASQSYYAPLSSSGIGQWTQTTNYPISVYGQSCTTYSSNIFCITGTTSFINNGANYAPLSSSGIGQWTTTTNYPTNYWLPSCHADSGYIYCIGGNAGNSLTSAVYYAPLSSSGIGQWSATNSYPLNIIFPSCVISSNHIYCIGGDSGTLNTGNAVNTAYYAQLYPTQTTSATTVPEFPNSALILYMGFASFLIFGVAKNRFIPFK